MKTITFTKAELQALIIITKNSTLHQDAMEALFRKKKDREIAYNACEKLHE